MAAGERELEGQEVRVYFTSGRERPPTLRPGLFLVHKCLGNRKGWSMTHAPTGAHVLSTRLKGTAWDFLKELECAAEEDWPTMIEKMQRTALRENI